MDSRRRFIVQIASWPASFVFGRPSQPEIRKQLAEKGLAIGRVSGDNLRIIPFDAPQIDRRYPIHPLRVPSPAQRLAYSWSNAGTAVVFLRGDPFKTQSLLVVDNAGEIRWSLPVMPLPPLGVPSLSPDGKCVALLTRDKTHFRLWHLAAAGAPIEVASAQIEDNPNLCGFTVGWSMDSTRNVVSWNGQVVVCGTDGKVVITKGDNPAWSPNQKWISFEGSDGHLVTMDSAAGKKIVFRSRRKISGVPSGIWSPDSEYILCNEQTVSRKGPSSDVTLYRLADGASTVLWNNLGINISDCGIISNWREWANRLPER